MPPPKDISSLTNATRQHWDESAPYQKQTDLWPQLTQGFSKKDYSVLDNILTSCLVSCGVSDAKLVQIGCNNGREILSAFALGTRVGLGIDQSAPFVEDATKLRDISGHNCQFLCCDIYNLPPETDTDFDIALITIGVLNWMPDLASFFAVVAKLLRPSGRLVIYETHPVLEMFDPECPTPQTTVFSYFRQEPHILNDIITYDGQKKPATSSSSWFPHQVGQILTAILKGELNITGFEEFAHSINDAPYDIYQNQEVQLPMSYLLQAVKP